jgi:hypothetical protein
MSGKSVMPGAAANATAISKPLPIGRIGEFEGTSQSHSPPRHLTLAMQQIQARALMCLAAVGPGADQVLSKDCHRCLYGNDAVLDTRQQQENARRRSSPFSSRSSRYTRRGANRKGSFLIPAGRLEIHDLSDNPASAYFRGERSLHNTSGAPARSLSHCHSPI